MIRISELRIRKKGSAFVFIADVDPLITSFEEKLKHWTRAVIVHNDEKKKDPRALDAKRRSGGKPAGWGMPGGGIFDWKDPNIEIPLTVPPDCCCETPVEAALREMFEESGLVIDIGDPHLVANLRSYHQELVANLRNCRQETEGPQKMRYFDKAVQGRLLLIHQYAKAVEELGLIDVIGQFPKDNHVLHQFFVDANHLIDKNALTTKVAEADNFSKFDPAQNTGLTHWKSREELEAYAANYVSLKRASDDEDERLREEMREGGKRRKLGLGHIYFSHLDRMGFKVEQEQREDHLHVQ